MLVRVLKLFLTKETPSIFFKSAWYPNGIICFGHKVGYNYLQIIVYRANYTSSLTFTL